MAQCRLHQNFFRKGARDHSDGVGLGLMLQYLLHIITTDMLGITQTWQVNDSR